jgi:hypothetical protein
MLLRIVRVFILCGCSSIAGAGCRGSATPGSGGSPGSGGLGRGGDGGAAGGARVAGSGGAAGGGGERGTGGRTGVADGGADCITQSAIISTKIATVGIVTWSATVPGLKSARIDFGPTTSYGLTAPVDSPASSGNTTLLLGMKQSKLYHYRITATGRDGDCVGPDGTLQTGGLMTGLPKIVRDTKIPAGLFGGFLITGQYVNTGGLGPPAYIADADGDMVWAYKFPTNVTGATMSYDGKFMWINSANANDPAGAVVQRVAMDGSTVEDKSSAFAGLNHQLTVLPDETVAFYAYNPSRGCEDIKEYTPSTGKVRVIVNSADAQGGASGCHLNYITYSRADDALIFSDMDSQVVVKIRRSDGSTVWIANGPHATVTGDTWKGIQHGLHVLETNPAQGYDRFLLYNNNSKIVPGMLGSAGGDGTGANIFELKVEYLGGKQITKLWTYKTGVVSDVMGDVQRLDNGNTVIGHSLAGVVQEIDAGNTLLQEWSFPAGSSIGYIQKRKTLYGPPPK